MYTNGGGSLMISALSDPWTPSGNAVAIAQRTQSWENSPQGCCIENPWAVIHNGQLSVLYAANWYASTGYAEGLLKFNGGNLLDPNSWTKVAGPVFGGSNSSSPGYGAGTAALFLLRMEPRHGLHITRGLKTILPGTLATSGYNA